MHSISVDVSSVTQTGVAHCNLIINQQDVGVLYLSQQEKQLLVDTLRHGAEHDHQLVVTETSTYQDDQEFDLLDDED